MRSLILLGIVVALGCGGGDDDTAGTSCGGFAGATCNGGQFCDHADDRCAAADGAGICEERPTVCAPVLAPVCGCDGKRYGNACDAHAAGTDVSQATDCDP
jgi:hypothetical protein